ncbi:MAG: hypothetical protein AB8I08_05725 [Sandaracinaceae bacterium]
MTRFAFLSCLPLLVIACDGGVPADTDADVEDLDASVDEELVCDGGCWVQRCREVAYATGAPTSTLDVGEMREGEYVPYADGGQATLVFGFQGGVMIEPVVRVPTEEIGASDCVQIVVRNRPDPAYPDLAGELGRFSRTEYIDPLRPIEAGNLSATVFNQLGWVTEPELRMILEVEARGVDWVRSAEFALHVVDADGLDACDVVPRQSLFGCERAVLDGTVTVDAVGDTEGLGCDEMVDMVVTLAPDVDVPAECVELTRTVSVSRGCVQREGYAVGASLTESRWELPLGGESDCTSPELGLVTTGCACL